MDVDKSDKLIRLLDTVVIKLEGGTEEDLKVLDEPTAVEITNDKPGKEAFQIVSLMFFLNMFFYIYIWQ